LAVSQMDEVTQQNAALVEEAAAAAESLEEQASNLTQAVSVFRVSTAGNVEGAQSLQKPTLSASEGMRLLKSSPAMGFDDEWKEF